MEQAVARLAAACRLCGRNMQKMRIEVCCGFETGLAWSLGWVQADSQPIHRGHDEANFLVGNVKRYRIWMSLKAHEAAIQIQLCIAPSSQLYSLQIAIETAICFRS